MSKRSTVYTVLPQNLREELDAKLIANGFSCYIPLSQWLDSKGFKISAGSINRYGWRLERRWEPVRLATEQAKAIIRAAPDDDGAMYDALIRLIQEKLFNVLVQFGSMGSEKLAIGELAELVVTVGRASLDQKKFVLEKRARKVRKAGEETGGAEKYKGISPETERKIRDALAGKGDPDLIESLNPIPRRTNGSASSWTR
ncbi:MAG TPA: DUF3486 family protein [Candidatus Binataceae bacterium]|nr:DUF3486 family protein [Candidatus Binataceae bacterium]